jgi:RNA polymerase sigma-70 factor (ECF subfamily)
MAQFDDTGLMAEVRVGNVEAFGELFDRFGARAYRVAFAVCRDEDVAQDAVQDAFLSLWKGRETYDARRGSVAAWVLIGVRHRAIDITRRTSRHTAHRADEEGLEEPVATDDPSQTVIRRDDTRRLLDALVQLPDAQREVITLAYYGQLSHIEIATRLGVPPGTVKGRMRLGLERLRAGAESIA